MNIRKHIHAGSMSAALVVASLFGIGLTSAAQAAPSAAIKCRVSNVTTTQNTARVTITSNRKIHYGQTSVKFSYYDRNMRQQWVTMDAGYGAVIYVRRPATAREWGLFKGWHAGTRCSDYAVGGPSGSIR